MPENLNRQNCRFIMRNMASVKQGTLAAPKEWWKHMDSEKRPFWKRDRTAFKAKIQAGIDEYEQIAVDCEIDIAMDCYHGHLCPRCQARENAK